ncbi:MAG: zinc-binding alcohol dehydrogenase [Desulfobacterales bacterium]|nr:zinc-binding alcohol dehydrogenase [Desulfobacterales bacterium]
MQRMSVIFAEPYRIEIDQSAKPAPGDEEVLIKTHISAISPGTEMLVYRGQLGAGIQTDTAIPELARPFGYPLAYGYACVGQIVEVGQSIDTKWLGQNVFCFHPHESHFIARLESLISLPEDLDPADAVFLATMETAVNFLMDGRPVIGEIVVLFGLGIVGLLTAALLARLPLNGLIAFDPYPLRREKAKEVGIPLVLNPERPEEFDEVIKNLKCHLGTPGADLIYELSGNPAALNQAIAVAGFDSRIVVGSWYGTKKTDLNLGTSFHRNRIQLISSQVSTLAPRFSSRWTKKRRIKVALEMLRELNPARFITHRFDVQQAKEAYHLLDQNPKETVQVVLTYE